MKTAQDLVLDAKTRIREIGHQEMLALQQAGTPIVDVREPAEYLEGHIPGAINIPRGVLEFQVDGHPAVNCQQDPALAHRGSALVLCCRSGARSTLAADALRQLGFAEPLSLVGGFSGWLAAAGAVTAGEQP